MYNVNANTKLETQLKNLKQSQILKHKHKNKARNTNLKLMISRTRKPVSMQHRACHSKPKLGLEAWGQKGFFRSFSPHSQKFRDCRLLVKKLNRSV